LSHCRFPAPPICRPQQYQPELEEAADLRERGDDVDDDGHQSDAGLASTGRGGGRLEPRNADVALDGEADGQPDGRRVEHRRQEVDRREVEEAPAVGNTDRIRVETATLKQSQCVEAQV